jgi:hypothetical protein
MAYSPFVFVVLYLCISFEAVHLIFSIFKKNRPFVHGSYSGFLGRLYKYVCRGGFLPLCWKEKNEK